MADPTIDIVVDITAVLDSDEAALNTWLRSTAAADGLVYADYYSQFVGKTATLLKDGLHPNAAGYAVMDATLTGSEGWR